MIDRLTRKLYLASGDRYWLVLVAGEGGVSAVIAMITVALIALFFDPPVGAALLVLGLSAVFTVLAVFYAAVRARPTLEAVRAWRKIENPTDEETVTAWTAATSFTFRQYRRHTVTVTLIAAVPICVIATILWNLGWADFGAMILACIVPSAYATVLSYSLGELLAKPLVEDIAVALPDDFPFGAENLPIGTRLRLATPAYTAGTALFVVGLLGRTGGARDLAIAVVVSIVVGVALSHELTALLTSAITGPIHAVRHQLTQIRRGNYGARVPVLSGDELGELSHDFNLMARGLQEREEMRAAFGTYVDKEVARLILSGQFPREGVEVDVSILFADVRGFTSYAERAAPTEVIATLNALFEQIVPIVERYGGHVDKFIGDGLLAVFGAPEPLADHADRAVAAAQEISRVTASGLTIACGVNTGRVVAGPIGGAGRLNFSVIGDAVNVAARVEAATRQTGDDVLFTASTRDLLSASLGVTSRGKLPLKGKAEPLELFTVDRVARG